MTAASNRILVAVLAVFAIGAGIIVYNGRPAAVLARNAAASPPVAAPASSTAPAPVDVSTPTAPSSEGGYAMSDIQAHASFENCWTVVDGDVYDLTTWISRHPGGARPIQGMCGIDSTERFTRKHGKSGAAKAALALLKVGSLKR